MDNNIISNYFSGQYSVTVIDFLSEIIDAIPNISVITKIEDWRGLVLIKIKKRS